MVHIGVNYKEGGGNASIITPIDHGEEVVENHKRDVGNTGVQRGAEGGWDADNSYIHRPQAGECGAMGGSMYNFQIILTVTWVIGRGAEKDTLVETRVAVEGS